MKKCIALILFVILSMQLVQAQQKLIVKKFNGKRSYLFQEDERLKLRLKTGEVLSGRWYYASENSIILGGEEVELKNIRWVDLSAKESGIYLLRKGQDLLIIAGVGYFTIAQLNTLIETGKFAGGDQVLGVSAGLVTGGLVCAALDRVFRKRKVAVGGRRFSISLIE